MLKTAAEIRCTDGKCPYFSIRAKGAELESLNRGNNKNAADAKCTGSGSDL